MPDFRDGVGIGQPRLRFDKWEHGYSIPIAALLLATLALGSLALVERSGSILEGAKDRAAELRIRLAADAGYHAFLARFAEAGSVPSGPSIRIDLNGAQVQVMSMSEFSKVDLNLGSMVLLRGLFRSLGFDDAKARDIAREIVDHRGTANQNVFYQVEDLLVLRSVGLQDLERMRPFLTVYSTASGVDIASAPTEVLAGIPGISLETAQRIARSGGNLDGITSSESGTLSAHWARARPVFTVSARATGEGGTEYVREVAVDLTDARHPVVLRWTRSFDQDVAAPADG